MPLVDRQRLVACRWCLYYRSFSQPFVNTEQESKKKTDDKRVDHLTHLMLFALPLKGLGHEIELKFFLTKMDTSRLNKNLYWFLNFKNESPLSYPFAIFHGVKLKTYGRNNNYWGCLQIQFNTFQYYF